MSCSAGRRSRRPTSPGRVVAVIDVLRASTSIAAALANGARAVIPLESPDDVVTRAKALERVRRPARRRADDAARFPASTSATRRSSSRARPSRARPILMTTTNGTPAIANSQGARDVVDRLVRQLHGGARDAARRAARRRRHHAGLRRTRSAVRARGRRMRRAVRVPTSSKRLTGRRAERRRAGVRADRPEVRRPRSCACSRRRSTAARCATRASATTSIACAAVDSYPVIPLYQDRQITKLGPDRER